jgi:hypothetical protein
MEPKPGTARVSEAWSGAAANAATAVSFPCRCWACIGAAFTDAKRVISGGKPVFAQPFVPAMPRHSALLRLSPKVHPREGHWSRTRLPRWPAASGPGVRPERQVPHLRSLAGAPATEMLAKPNDPRLARLPCNHL